MIGLALMAMMSIFGSSASASTDAAIGKSLTSQFIVSNVVGQPFSTDVAEQIRSLDGVAGVTQLRRPSPSSRAAAAPGRSVSTRRRSGSPSPSRRSQGSFADLGPGTVAISEAAGEGQGLRARRQRHDGVPGQDIKLRVVALFPSNPALPGDYLVTPDTLEKGGLTPLDAMVFVTKEPGASTDAVRDEIEEVIEDLPTVTVKDPEGFAAEQKEQVNQFLYLIYGLLGLSVIIAILGVINTLSLSVIERTREVGLLRAVGVTRRQLRTMIRLESVVVAVLGGVLGTVDGGAVRRHDGDRAGGRGPDRAGHPVAVAGRLPAPGGRRRGASPPWFRPVGRPGSTCSRPSEQSDPSAFAEQRLKVWNLGTSGPHAPGVR